MLDYVIVGMLDCLSGYFVPMSAAMSDYVIMSDYIIMSDNIIMSD